MTTPDRHYDVEVKAHVRAYTGYRCRYITSPEFKCQVPEGSDPLSFLSAYLGALKEAIDQLRDQKPDLGFLPEPEPEPVDLATALEEDRELMVDFAKATLIEKMVTWRIERVSEGVAGDRPPYHGALRLLARELLELKLQARESYRAWRYGNDEELFKQMEKLGGLLPWGIECSPELDDNQDATP